jgi:hypothetical protein
MRFYVEEDASEPDIMDQASQDLQLHGGVLVDNLEEATHILADTIADIGAAQSSQAQLPCLARRTSTWVFECCKLHTTVWSKISLLWKGWDFQPRPRSPIPNPEGKAFVITLTGYTGVQRDTLKKLIEKSGATCTPALTKGNTHLLCNTPTSKKAQAATNWGVQVVNHLWIMDSILMWAWQPCERYTRAGEEILREGDWTILDDVTVQSGVIVHPRLLAEKTWPIAVAAADDEEEYEIAESVDAQAAEEAASLHDSNNGIEETQSSQGSGDAGQRQHATAAVAGVNAANDDEHKGAASPPVHATVSSPLQASVIKTSKQQRHSDGASPVLSHSVSFADGQAAGGSVGKEEHTSEHPRERDEMEEKGDEKKEGEKEEDGVNMFVYPSPKKGSSAASRSKDSMQKQGQDEKEHGTRTNRRAQSPFASQAASAVLAELGGDVSGGIDAEDEGRQGDDVEVASNGEGREGRESSPDFGESSPALGDRHDSQGTGVSTSNSVSKTNSVSKASKSGRCLASEFQYDLDDATQNESSDYLGGGDGGEEDKHGEDGVADSADVKATTRNLGESSHLVSEGSPRSPTGKTAETRAAVATHASPPQNGVARGRGRPRKGAHDGKKSAPSEEAAAAEAAAAAALVTHSPAVAAAEQRSSRVGSRGKGTNAEKAGRKDEMLDQDVPGQFMSVAFGDYQDAGACESLDFDGKDSPMVCERERVCVCVYVCVCLYMHCRSSDYCAWSLCGAIPLISKIVRLFDCVYLSESG